MCKVLALEVKHKISKDTFNIYINSKKHIKFDYDKTTDTVDGILNELIYAIDDEFDEVTINQLKKDMYILLKSKRINGIYYGDLCRF